MTTLEMKENLKAKCTEAWETYKSYEDLLGSDSIYTQKQLSVWVTYIDLYKEFFGELII